MDKLRARSAVDDSDVSPDVAPVDNPDEPADFETGLPRHWRFGGEVRWCGEVGHCTGIPDEPQLVGELSPDGQRGQIVGRSTCRQDTMDLQGKTCGWFGKALIWDLQSKI